jgi:K+-sensing histidine kinase KdpD
MRGKTIARICALFVLLGSLFALQILYGNISRLQATQKGRAQGRTTETRVLYQAVPDFQEHLRKQAIAERERERRREARQKELAEERRRQSSEEAAEVTPEGTATAPVQPAPSADAAVESPPEPAGAGANPSDGG